MSSRRIGTIALAASTILVTGVGVAVPATASVRPAQASHGCPYGDVCIYPQNAGWNGDRPSLKYYKYGCYNLSNQVGTHRVFNNQISTRSDPDPVVYGDKAFGCTSTTAVFQVAVTGTYKDVNLTPVNGIRLVSATY